MKRLSLGVLALSIVSACGGPPSPVPPSDSSGPRPVASNTDANNDAYLYLEDVTGEKALAFARAHDEKSEKELTADPGFKALESKLFAIYSSKERIPAPRVTGEVVRNFWTDADHPRGLWRQTSIADYRKAKPNWSLILDIDALGKAQNESWVFHGAECLLPARKKCLLRLSRGGGDAEVIREFDIDKKAFVAGGFELKEGKSTVAWKDENTIYVGTDFGEGSLTRPGYPRISKEWKRGTPLGAAKTIFEGTVNDNGVGCLRDSTHEPKRDLCAREIDFEHTEVSVLVKDAYVKLDKPADADASVWDDELLLRLRSEWKVGAKTFAKGSLLATNLESFPRRKARIPGHFRAKCACRARLVRRNEDAHLHQRPRRREEPHHRVQPQGGRQIDKRWVGTPVDEKVGSVGRGGLRRSPDRPSVALARGLHRSGHARSLRSEYEEAGDGEAITGLFSTRARWSRSSTSRRRRTAPRFPISKSRGRTGAAPPPPCSMRTADSRSRSRRSTPPARARAGSSGAACSYRPTSAAAANTVRRGTRRR